MASPQQLPVGITRVHPHTRRTLRTAADLASCVNWVWRVRAKRRGTGDFDQLYPQDVRDSIQTTLDYLQHERSTAINDLRRDAARQGSDIFTDDVKAYLARRASASDYRGRVRSLFLWDEWLSNKLGSRFKTTKITPELVELALEDWKQATVVRKKKGGKLQRRWASATLRTRALHLSNLFGVLYPDVANPVLALKDRLPPKSPEVEKAQPLSVVMTLLDQIRNPPVVAQRQYPSFASVRAALLGFAHITIQELWSIRDARAFDLRAGQLRIPAKRVVERYTTVDGHGVVRVVVEQREPRVVNLTPDGLEASRQYLAYPDRYQGGGKLTKFGYFAIGSFRQMLQSACRSAGLESPISPSDFGTTQAPSYEEVRAIVHAMRHDVVPYRPTADRTRNAKAFIRASVMAHTGARVGEVAMLEPEDVRLNERAVLMPTEKHRRNAGRMERVISRRRIPLNDYGLAALKLFVKHDLFDRLSDRSRVPDETMVPWYQELYYQVVVAARRVKDPHTGASLYFTPHCFRHSFATALAPLIGGDAKTGAKIMGHSAQTFMRYVRANDETARTAVDKMIADLPPLGQPMTTPTGTSSLRVVVTGGTL
ncbi:MAG: site-specific integrase [Vicinamibacterales bacterium]